MTCEYSSDATRRQARASADGKAASQAVDKKRARYPPRGGELIPAVLESGARPADELAAMVRSHGRDLPATERSAAIADTWRQMQRRLATGNAEPAKRPHRPRRPDETMTNYPPPSWERPNENVNVNLPLLACLLA